MHDSRDFEASEDHSECGPSGTANHRSRPPSPAGVRARPLRETINAILYLLRAGCPWRHLPRRRDVRRDRPPTISFATSGKLARRTRSRTNCIRICGKTWGVKRAPRPQSKPRQGLGKSRRHASRLRRSRLDRDRDQTTRAIVVFFSQSNKGGKSVFRPADPATIPKIDTL
ncbi:MAG: transposase [Methylocella sp.]